MRFFLLVILLLLFPLSAVNSQAQDIEDRFVSDSHGFSIARPDPAWTFQEEASASDGSYNLVMLPDVGQPQLRGTIMAAPLTEAMDATAVRDAVLKMIEGIDTYTLVELISTEANGAQAPGFCIDVKTPEGTLRIHQFYVIANEMQYTLVFLAPPDQFESWLTVSSDLWKSFKTETVSEETRMEHKILNLGARCGTEIDWSDTWEEASTKAKELNRLIMIRVRIYRGFTIADDARSGPFMDHDIISLVNERFVALNFVPGSDAPFVSQESYGLSETAFGSSILLSTPDGQIVGDTCSIESASLHDFLLLHLAKHPQLSLAAPPPQGFDRLDIAEWHMHRGDYEKAMKFVESPTTPRGHSIKAALLRRMRKGADALLEIKKAQALVEGTTLAELWLDEAIVLMKMDRIAEASLLLDQILSHEPACSRKPEAMYWQGACRLRLTENTSEAETLWKQLIADHGQDRWAWKAAASLKSSAFLMGESGRLDWPPENVIAANWPPAPRKLDPSQAEKAERDALAFLLNNQRDDGSWICPTATMNPNDHEPDYFTQAVTAICGQSLIAYNEEPEVQTAIMKTLAFLRKIRVEEKKREDAIYFMDYKFWKNSYVLWFMADCVLAGVLDVDQLEAEMNEIVTELEAIQNDRGGWSYLITTDLGAASDKPRLSMSFVTAQLAMALMDAKSAGANVPDEMIEEALGCVERMRNPDGTFEYMVDHAAEGAPRNTSPEGAAGRGPLCSLALYLGGRCETDSIVQALDLFVKHRHYYAKEHGKTMMHAGPHAQGSHYLMFDYAYAAEAVRELPEETRDSYRTVLLEQILSERTEEGSYVDNPLLGWHYGTAMALMAFQHLGI